MKKVTMLVAIFFICFPLAKANAGGGASGLVQYAQALNSLSRNMSILVSTGGGTLLPFEAVDAGNLQKFSLALQYQEALVSQQEATGSTWGYLNGTNFDRVTSYNLSVQTQNKDYGRLTATVDAANVAVDHLLNDPTCTPPSCPTRVQFYKLLCQAAYGTSNCAIPGDGAEQ